MTNQENRAKASYSELTNMGQIVEAIVSANLWPRSLSEFLEEAIWKAYPPTGK